MVKRSRQTRELKVLKPGKPCRFPAGISQYCIQPSGSPLAKLNATNPDSASLPRRLRASRRERPTRPTSRHSWACGISRSPAVFAALGLLVCAGYGVAQTPEALSSPSALKKLSLEQLMDVEVTSVSKRAEKLSETASAIQVITGEDIRRSGASSLPEALRL